MREEYWCEWLRLGERGGGGYAFDGQSSITKKLAKKAKIKKKKTNVLRYRNLHQFSATVSNIHQNVRHIVGHKFKFHAQSHLMPVGATHEKFCAPKIEFLRLCVCVFFSKINSQLRNAAYSPAEVRIGPEFAALLPKFFENSQDGPDISKISVRPDPSHPGPSSLTFITLTKSMRETDGRRWKYGWMGHFFLPSPLHFLDSAKIVSKTENAVGG